MQWGRAPGRRRYLGFEMEGYSVVHRSLVEPVTLGGAPRDVAILNGTIGAVMLFGLHSWIGGPVFLALHLVAVMLTKIDPYFMDTFRRHINHRGYYEA